MLSQETFKSGLRILKANFGLKPDDETMKIWYSFLIELDDYWFLAGIKLLCNNEETLYPSSNIQLKIKKWTAIAQNEAIAAKERAKHIEDQKQWKTRYLEIYNENEKSSKERAQLSYQRLLKTIKLKLPEVTL